MPIKHEARPGGHASVRPYHDRLADSVAPKEAADPRLERSKGMRVNVHARVSRVPAKTGRGQLQRGTESHRWHGLDLFVVLRALPS